MSSNLTTLGSLNSSFEQLYRFNHLLTDNHDNARLWVIMMRKTIRFTGIRANFKRYKVIFLWCVLNLFYWLIWFSTSLKNLPLIYWLIISALFFWLSLSILLKLIYKESGYSLKVKSVIKTYRKTAIIVFVNSAKGIPHVEKQLKATKQISLGHDCWILVGNRHSGEIEKLVLDYGYHYFSKYDVERWGTTQVSVWNSHKMLLGSQHYAENLDAWMDKYGDNYFHITHLEFYKLSLIKYLNKAVHKQIESRAPASQLINLINSKNWVYSGFVNQNIQGMRFSFANLSFYSRKAWKEGLLF